MINKNFLILFFGILLVSLVSAQTDFNYKQNTEIGIKIICINNGWCSSSAICNVSVFDPDGVVILDGVQAVQAASLAYFNVILNSTQTSKLGNYQVKGFCKDGSVSKEIDFSFPITKIGDSISTGQALLYILLIVLVLILMIVFGTITIRTPYENLGEKTKRGDIITKVTKTKYVKLFAAWITYYLFIWLFSIITSLANNYIRFDAIGGLLSNSYVFLYILGLGISITITWLIFYNVWKDIILNKTILREGKAFLNEL